MSSMNNGGNLRILEFNNFAAFQTSLFVHPSSHICNPQSFSDAIPTPFSVDSFIFYKFCKNISIYFFGGISVFFFKPSTTPTFLWKEQKNLLFIIHVLSSFSKNIILYCFRSLWKNIFYIVKHITVCCKNNVFDWYCNTLVHFNICCHLFMMVNVVKCRNLLYFDKQQSS